MKNPRVFSEKKYHTLSKTEVKLIEKVIDKIVSNHENDEWWAIDNGIKSTVSVKLSRLLADEEFEELSKEEEARLAAEEYDRKQTYQKEFDKEKALELQAEKDSEDIFKSIQEE
jgi:hypothetical protein